MGNFKIVRDNILNRRTIKPEQMNGRTIPDQDIWDLLELANWAPTHGLTEPWRFKVFSGENRIKFNQLHAELYKVAAKEKALEKKYQKIMHRADNCSHLVALIMERGLNQKIPEIEEIAATACAVQNILLGACAKNIAAYWGSGGMTYDPRMIKLLELEEQDVKLMGFLYLGYSDEEILFSGRRQSTIANKVDWEGYK